MVLINMIIAIVLEAFVEVKEETKRKSIWKDIYMGIRRRIRMFANCFFRKKKFISVSRLRRALEATNEEFISMDRLKTYTPSSTPPPPEFHWYLVKTQNKKPLREKLYEKRHDVYHKENFVGQGRSK